MKQTINLHQFREAFRLHERTNFSYEGLAVLFDALEDFEAGGGEEMEFDVIGLCCDFVEMSLPELLEQYSNISNEPLTDDNETEIIGLATDYLQDETWLCGLTEQNTFVFQQF
jgi:hypothetical protein